MLTYNDLLIRCRGEREHAFRNEEIHASLAAYPDRIDALERAVGSLIEQVDTLHVFLNDFQTVPSFLDHEKIYITHSGDVGFRGECGKYYWSDDLEGFHLICSDLLIYPSDYVATMVGAIESRGRKSVVSCGGYIFHFPFAGFAQSADTFRETDFKSAEIDVHAVRDGALAYHTSTISISRHFFYQPELSDLWFSVAAQEQGVKMVCLSTPANWFTISDTPVIQQNDTQTEFYRTFLVQAWYGTESGTSEGKHDIHDTFDRLFVMNLDRRPDRWERIEAISRQHHLHFTRFPASDGSLENNREAWQKYAKHPLQSLPDGIDPLITFTDKFTKYYHYIARIQFMESKFGRKAVQTPGAWGYALTYIRILEEAIRQNYRRILIFDDDVILHKQFNALFEQGMGILPPDWKLIMLGAMQHHWEPWIIFYKERFYIGRGSSVASHAVGIDNKMFLPLLFYAQRLDLPIDEGAVFHVQNVYANQCFIFFPNLAIQDLSESDISSSAMKQEDSDRWIRMFRWDRDLYDFGK
jgi:GR25 family glycosyltransferase involved in LPS biosynthesis